MVVPGEVVPMLTIAIVSFNTRDLLDACLSSVEKSILATPGLTTKVIVVDNSSSDGSIEMVREKYPGASIHEMGRNRGFAAANNVVLEHAKSRYVLLLNPDTEVRQNGIGAMVDFMESRPEAGACGGRLVYPDGGFQHSCYRFPSLAMTFLDYFPINHRVSDSWINGRYPRAWYEQPFQVDHPLGACLMIRRQVFDQIGLMDDRFFMYCEELDLCWRILQAGWEIWYTPGATVVHHAGASTRQFRGRMLVELNRSRLQFFAKHYPPMFSQFVRGIVLLGTAHELFQAAVDRIRGRITSQDWRSRRDTYLQVLAL